MPARPILKIIKINPKLRKIFQDKSQHFAKPRWELIRKYVLGQKILDVGMGMGTLARNMIQAGYSVAGIDVDNTSLYDDLKPRIYDGIRMPFAKDSFDTSTIICVLHHCRDQEIVLREAMRVAKRLIIIEDTYRNKLEKLLIAIRDSIENWEFYRHQYRSYSEWRKLCVRNGWKVRHIKSWSSFDFGLLYGRQSLFVVEK